MNRGLMLIDTAAMYVRAFYGVPLSLRAPDGRPVNAVRGLLDTLAGFVGEYRPGGLACCWDEAWRPAWRVALAGSYKTARANPDGSERMPPELATQVPLVRETLVVFGLPVVGAEDFEADDVIATLAERADGPVDVVTGDRDLFQLVDDARGVRVLYCARGAARHEVVDGAWVRERFGVAPAAYVDFAVLRGDPSDGLPGVAGVGEKTAARLLGTYRTVHGVLLAGATGKLPGRLGDALMDAIGYAGPAKRVATARTDVPLPDLDLTLPAAPPDPSRLASWCDALGLGGSAERLAQALWGPMALSRSRA